MRWIFFHSPLHGWGWELLDGDGAARAESRRAFETRDDARHDAALHGFDPAADAVPGAAPEPHVMIVQNDVDIGRDVARLLHRFRATVSSSCEHALELAQAVSFDCYVVDCAMRDGTLSRFCSALHAFDPRVPVVVYSGAQHEQDGADALIAGANVMLERPIDGMRLSYTVDALLHLTQGRAREARAAELLALQEAFIERAAETQAFAGRQSTWLSADYEQRRDFIEDHAQRVRACRIFLRSGGTRAAFEREWRNLLDDGSQPTH